MGKGAKGRGFGVNPGNILDQTQLRFFILAGQRRSISAEIAGDAVL